MRETVRRKNAVSHGSSPYIRRCSRAHESPHDMRGILRHIKCGATHDITIQNTVRQQTPVTVQYAGKWSVCTMRFQSCNNRIICGWWWETNALGPLIDILRKTYAHGHNTTPHIIRCSQLIGKTRVKDTSGEKHSHLPWGEVGGVGEASVARRASVETLSLAASSAARRWEVDLGNRRGMVNSFQTGGWGERMTRRIELVCEMWDRWVRYYGGGWLSVGIMRVVAS